MDISKELGVEMQKTVVPFKQVFFEIVGKCNAKCAYCITGNGSQTGTFVDVDKFKTTIKDLYNRGLTDENTNFALFNWGEPMLHPRLLEILEFLDTLNIKFSLSTNLSSIPKQLSANVLKNLTKITVSMPGFSQNSYSKIHGFNFSKILENINTLSTIIPKNKISISFHLYQFNISEIKAAQEYFNHLGIKIFSSFAFFNDYHMATNYLTNNLNKEEMLKVSKELLLFYVDDLIAQMPQGYRCPQFDMLSIDENCNVINCCAAPKDSPDYVVSECSNLRLDALDQRHKTSLCQECMSTKLAYWVHNAGHASNDFMHAILK
jgi:pyruvate-formate lyase-activating enzyme